MTRVVFVTCDTTAHGTADDALAARALETRGIVVDSIPWTRLTRMEAGDHLVLRSTWDYHRRADEFSQWLTCVEAASARLHNPLPTVRWNMHKRYLVDLAARGLSVVPSVLVQRGQHANLPAEMECHGWREVVVKPAVSAGAHETFRATAGDHAAGERLVALCQRADVLVQPFLPEIETGEWSFIFLGGAFSHAVRKIPAPGNFRVQHHFGGQEQPAVPSQELVRQASALLEGARVDALYARVDAVEVDGRLLLMELELIEPELFFRMDDHAPGRFAEAFLTRLGT